MKLFGGAISTDIPTTLLDASDLREVPDNQEVYVGTYQTFDISVIVELLEPVQVGNIVDALVYHVEETHRVSSTPHDKREQPLETATMKLGDYEYAERIDVVKTKEGYIPLVFGLLRLTEYKTDVLITCTVSPLMDHPGTQEVDTQRELVSKIVRTFKVLDPNLFIQETQEVERSEGHHPVV